MITQSHFRQRKQKGRVTRHDDANHPNSWAVNHRLKSGMPVIPLSALAFVVVRLAHVIEIRHELVQELHVMLPSE